MTLYERLSGWKKPGDNYLIRTGKSIVLDLVWVIPVVIVVTVIVLVI